MALYKNKEENWIKLSIVLDLQYVYGLHVDWRCVSIYSVFVSHHLLPYMHTLAFPRLFIHYTTLNI